MANNPLTAQINSPLVDDKGIATWPWSLFFTEVSRRLNEPVASVPSPTSAPSIYLGSHADRMARGADTVSDGTLFWEADRKVLYLARNLSWIPVYSRFAVTQADLAGIALRPNDAGLSVYVSDYAHWLEWDGAAFGWSGYDAHQAGMLAFFDSDPGAGWKAIDGTGDDGHAIAAGHPIRILQADGTTRSVTRLDSLTGYLKGGTFDGSQNGAVAPDISQPTFTGATGVTGADSATHAFPVGSSTTLTLPDHPHTHTYTPAGTVSSPTASLPSDPIANMKARPFIRK